MSYAEGSIRRIGSVLQVFGGEMGFYGADQVAELPGTEGEASEALSDSDHNSNSMSQLPF